MNRYSTRPLRLLVSLSLATVALLGCEDEYPNNPMPDAGPLPTDLGMQVAPSPIAVCERDDLVIASIDLVADTVTLLNPTAAEIVVDSSSAYQLCQGPGRYSALPATSPVTIAAGGTATFDISGISTLGLEAPNGMLSLYKNSSFTTRDAMLDYVCWGDGAGTPRLDIAQRLGTDESVMWGDGGCADLAGATVIHRVAGSDGSAAADYTTTDPSLTCN